MVVGTMLLLVRLGESHSLKDKRRALKGVIEIARRKFNIAIAEVEFQDEWAAAGIGVACVSNSSTHVHSMLEQVLQYFEGHPELDVEVASREVLNV